MHSSLSLPALYELCTALAVLVSFAEAWLCPGQTLERGVHDSNWTAIEDKSLVYGGWKTEHSYRSAVWQGNVNDCEQGLRKGPVVAQDTARLADVHCRRQT